MILLDSRHVDKCTAGFLPRFNPVPAMSSWLDRGDANFWDKTGIRGHCIEIKRIIDLIESVLYSGRLIEQLRTARAAGFQQYTVIVQDWKKVGAEPQSGMLAYRMPKSWNPIPIPGTGSHGRPAKYIPYRRVDNFLNTLSLIEGVLIKYTYDEAETVDCIKDLYYWWQGELDEHTSTADNRLYTPVYLPGGTVPLVRKWANQLESIGLKRSKAVAGFFADGHSMATADEKEWMKIDGVGKGIALQAYNEIRGIKQ